MDSTEATGSNDNVVQKTASLELKIHPPPFTIKAHVTHSVEFQTKIWLTNVKSMLGANLYAVLPYSLKITPYSKSTYKKWG